MIVISDSVVLAQAAVGIDANNPRIGWHNVLTADNVSASEEAADYPAVNLANPATYLKWSGESTSEQTITVTLGSAQVVNYIGIARHNLGSTGATYSFESSADGGTWTEVTEARHPPDDHAIIHEFDDQNVGYYRLVITPDAEPPEIAVLYIGRVLRLPRRIYVGHTPFVFGRRTTVSSGFSEDGEFLGRVVRRQMYETGFSMSNLTPAWVRSDLEPFIRSARENPFFWAWRPGKYPAEVGYAWAMGDINPANEQPNGMMSFSLQMQGIR